METQLINSLAQLFSFGAAAFCLGCLFGAWIQKKRSHEETVLLINIWEKILTLSQDVETVYENSSFLAEEIDQQKRKSKIFRSEFLVIKKEVDALYNIDHEEDDITLELPIIEKD